MTAVTLEVGENTRITLHFSVALEDGTVVDTNFDSKPASCAIGDGSLLPGFERVLYGLHAGQEELFTMPPESAFGQRNPQNVQMVSRDRFDDEIELEEGLVLSFHNGDGELPGVVSKVGERDVEVDFNHPLAGETLLFKVKIIAVEPVVTH